MKRYKHLPGACLLVFLAMFLTPGISSAATSGAKPNIIFFLADDLGIDNLSCYGADRLQTPHIDKLAGEGVRFTRTFATPVCGPSRAMLITGQYPFRNGAIEIDNTMSTARPETCPSLPKLLKQHGYATGITGKWRQMKGEVADWGFDESVLSPSANGYYWEKQWLINGTPHQQEETVYFPAVMQRFALEFVAKHKDQPFFLYYPLINPHVPIERTPDTAEGTTDKKVLYADNIKWIDKCVGELMAKLDELGLKENTIVLFSGDNGSSGRPSPVKGRSLAGGKTEMREGGTNVPLVIRWPARAPSGKVVSDLVDFTDFLPTFAEITGFPMPKDHIIDGKSFAPQVRGEKGEPRTWVFSQLGQFYFVRNQEYRLDQDGVLWDVRDGPFVEKKIEPASETEADKNARSELHALATKLNPEGGKTWAKWTGFGNRGPGKKVAPGRAAPEPE